MKRNMRKLLTCLLAAVFLASTFMLAKQWYDRQKGIASYTNAGELASMQQPPQSAEGSQTLPSAPAADASAPVGPVWLPAPVEDDDPNMEALEATDLSALQQVNPEVVGWILIPGTNINFPITQGADNTFYLEHSWDGSPNQYGSIFLECMNSPDLTDFNTIIYGHRMNDGSMFASLHDFAQQDYWSAHPYVYIVTGDGVYRYEIFSTYVADTDSSTYGLSFNQEQTRIDFLRMALENSEIDTGITPATTDRIITLSTCTTWGYGSRRVVHARLRMIEQ